jgi:hypothetical protein
MIDNELTQYYEQNFSMMATEGWKFFIEDMEKIKTSINNIYEVKDEQTLKFRQGQLDIIDLVLGRKAMCEEVYEDITNETNI